MPAPTTMSCRLTEGRELRGLSVAELAEQIGVTRQSIYKYENGTQAPSEETVERTQPSRFFLHILFRHSRSFVSSYLFPRHENQ